MTRKTLNIILKFAVSLCAIGLAWQLVGGGATLEGLGLPSPVWMLATVLLQVAILGLLAVRLGIMMRVLGAGAEGFWWRFRLSWAAFGLNQIALGSIGGDGYRLVTLRQHAQNWYDPAVVVLGDRLIGLAGLMLVGSIGLAIMVYSGVTVFAAPVLAVLLLSILGGVVISYLAAHRFSTIAPKSRKSAGHLGAAALALPWRLATRPQGWAALGLAAVGHVMSVGMFYTLGRGFGLFPPFPETLVAVPSGLFAAMLPVSLGGWGTRELAISSAFVALNAEFAQSVTVSVLYGLACVALGLPAMLYVWRDVRAFEANG